MKKFFLIGTGIIFAVLVASCASTKSGVKVSPNNSELVDWTNRTVNGPSSPKWFTDLGKDDYAAFRKEFGIDKSYKVQHVDAKGDTEDAAKVASRLDASSRIAESVKAEVKSEASKTLNSAQISALEEVKVDIEINGLELVTQFWHATMNYDPETNARTKEYRCWSFYKISEENWKEAQVSYARKVLSAVSDPAVQNTMTGIISSLETVIK